MRTRLLTQSAISLSIPLKIILERQCTCIRALKKTGHFMGLTQEKTRGLPTRVSLTTNSAPLACGLLVPPQVLVVFLLSLRTVGILSLT